MSDKDKYYIDGLVKDKMVVHRAIALPKGKNKPDLQYKRTGENVYEIPETEKYVGSYDTAVSSVNPKDLKRTVVEHQLRKLEFLNTMFIQMGK